MIGEGEEWCPEATCGTEMCCGYLSALSAPSFFVVVTKKDEVSGLKREKKNNQWKTVTSAKHVDTAVEANKWAYQCSSSGFRLRNWGKPFFFFPLQPLPQMLLKWPDNLSRCIQGQSWRWTVQKHVFCEPECGNACKDSHVASRLCLFGVTSVRLLPARSCTLIQPCTPPGQRVSICQGLNNWNVGHGISISTW